MRKTKHILCTMISLLAALPWLRFSLELNAASGLERLDVGKSEHVHGHSGTS